VAGLAAVFPPGALGSHPNVERLEDLDATCVAVALHGGDDRRGRPMFLEEALVDEAGVGPDAVLELVFGGLAGDHRPHQPIEVGARREVAAGAGHDRHAHAIVGIDHVPGVAQPAQHLGVERVALAGTVQGEGDHGTVPVHEHRGLCRF